MPDIEPAIPRTKTITEPVRSDVAPHPDRLNPDIDEKCLNQFLDELYIQDYFEKARADDYH